MSKTKKETLTSSENVTRILDRSVALRRNERAKEATAIIVACRRIMRATGDWDAPLSEILSKAGLGTRAFYRLFQSKDELLLAVADLGVQEMLAAINTRLMGVEDPLERIAAWVDEWVDHSINEHTNLLIYRANLAARFPAESTRMHEQLCQPVADALARIPGADSQPRVDAQLIGHLVMGVLAHALATGEFTANDHSNLKRVVAKLSAPNPTDKRRPARRRT